MVYGTQLNDLASKILAKEDIVDVTYEEKTVTDLINWKYIFFILLGILTVEWFLRKRFGAY